MSIVLTFNQPIDPAGAAGRDRPRPPPPVHLGHRPGVARQGSLRSMTATFGMPQFGSLTGFASLY